MAIYGKYFEYNGRSSQEFGVMVGVFNNVSEIPIGLTRTVDKGEINKYRYRANHFGTTYDDVLEFDLGIIKDPCKYDGEDMKFKRSEIREICAWLTSPKLPKLYHMYDYDNDEIYDEYIDYYCIFTDITTDSTGDIYTLNFHVTCDCPFGYSKEITHTIESDNTAITTYEIENNSDEHEDYIYPVLKITPHNSGKLKIENVTDGNFFEIDVLANDIVNIDCQKLKIYDETKKLITFDDLGVDDIDKIYWFRLCYGLNQIKVTGDASIEISYRELRKVGAY